MTASSVREEISNDMKNHMVSLKIDGVTCHNRSFLGINVQYMFSDAMNLKIKTLSIGEVLGGHTSENLKTTVRTLTLQLLSYTLYVITN